MTEYNVGCINLELVSWPLGYAFDDFNEACDFAEGVLNDYGERVYVTGGNSFSYVKTHNDFRRERAGIFIENIWIANRDLRMKQYKKQEKVNWRKEGF